MTDRVRVVLGVAFVSFGVVAVVVGGGAYTYAWYSALAWSQSEEARRVERAAGAPAPIWLEDEAGATAPSAETGRATGAGAAPGEHALARGTSGVGLRTGPEGRDGPGPRDTDGAGDGGEGSTGSPRATAGSSPFDPPGVGDVLGAEREAAASQSGTPLRRAAASDVGVADVDFRFTDPPEPGAHARLQLAVRNRADVPTGPVSVTIPARWFESFDVLGAVPNVLLDRTEQDGLRYFDYPSVGPAETATFELHVVANNEDLDAPEVRVVLRDEEAELARAQPRTVAPKPRPGPARQVQIPSLNIRAGVVPTTWEPPEFVIGQIRDSAAVSLGNTVLIGHLRGPAGDVFNRLDRAKLGDEVVAVSRGVEFRFLVSDIVVLPNSDSSPMLPSETPRLTLMTCRGTWNPFRQDYSHRLWVIAEPPELAERTIAANRERAARAAEELARIEAEAEQAAADATATAIAEGAHVDSTQPAGADAADPTTPGVVAEARSTPRAATDPPAIAALGIVDATPTVAPLSTVTTPPAAPSTEPAPPSTAPPPPAAPPAPVAAGRPAPKPAEPRARESVFSPPVGANQVAQPAPSATALHLPEPPLVVIREPSPDARVPQRVKLRGALVGEQQPDGNLWLVVRADVEGSRWYVYGQEIVPDPGGGWELELELGGPPNIRHEIRFGTVDGPTHARLIRHVNERPGEPLAELPDGFEPQAAVTVVRR